MYKEFPPGDFGNLRLPGDHIVRTREIRYTRTGIKKSEKKISKIVRGVGLGGKHFGKKWGLADIRKPDDGLGRQC